MGPREEAILGLFAPGIGSPTNTARLRPTDCWGHNPNHTGCTLVRGAECAKEVQCHAKPETAVGLCREHYAEIFGERKVS
jgi:hypothetical protein